MSTGIRVSPPCINWVFVTRSMNTCSPWPGTGSCCVVWLTDPTIMRYSAHGVGDTLRSKLPPLLAPRAVTFLNRPINRDLPEAGPGADLPRTLEFSRDTPPRAYPILRIPIPSIAEYSTALASGGGLPQINFSRKYFLRCETIRFTSLIYDTL